jgi:RimJ/RimL family protein N-acetyltransferase
VSFDLQPTLTGELLELRPLRPEDFTALYAVASDPLLWEQHPEPDRYTELVFRKFFQGALDSGGAFVVIDRTDGRIIGSSRYCGYDAAAREVEIGWTFLMLDHAFRFVEHVVFRIGPRNLRSRRAMEKIGGVEIGVRPDSRGGEAVVYEIRDGWKP